MSEKELLLKLGLDKNEVEVYLSLLRIGHASIRQIADHTKINRGKTYEILKALVAKGFVVFQQKGERNRYSAESPQKIAVLIKAKETEIANIKASSPDIISGLMSYATVDTEAPRVKFYEDDEGVAAILKDVLQTVSNLSDKQYYAYSSRPIRQYVYRRFPSFTDRRIKENIFVKVIAVGTGGDPAPISERKFLPESDNELSSSYSLIYGNKLAMISVSSNLTPYGVVIEEQGVAAMQRLLFESLWKTLES